jgi:hypothetical protein
MFRYRSSITVGTYLIGLRIGSAPVYRATGDVDYKGANLSLDTGLIFTFATRKWTIGLALLGRSIEVSIMRPMPNALPIFFKKVS